MRLALDILLGALAALALYGTVLVSTARAAEPGEQARTSAYCTDIDDLGALVQAIEDEGTSLYLALMASPASSCIDLRMVGYEEGVPVVLLELLTVRRFGDQCLEFWLVRDIRGEEAVSWAPCDAEMDGGGPI